MEKSGTFRGGPERSNRKTGELAFRGIKDVNFPMKLKNKWQNYQKAH